jgi:hypothetical protein
VYGLWFAVRATRRAAYEESITERNSQATRERKQRLAVKKNAM